MLHYQSRLGTSHDVVGCLLLAYLQVFLHLQRVHSSIDLVSLINCAELARETKKIYDFAIGLGRHAEMTKKELTK